MKVEFLLSESERNDLDTEIKFNIASARADGAELVRFVLNRGGEDDKVDYNKSIGTVTKLLRALVKAGSIQFFVLGSQVDSSSLESAFLTNKYYDYIISDDEAHLYVYVKL